MMDIHIYIYILQINTDTYYFLLLTALNPPSFPLTYTLPLTVWARRQLSAKNGGSWGSMFVEDDTTANLHTSQLNPKFFTQEDEKT